MRSISAEIVEATWKDVALLPEKRARSEVARSA